VNIKTNHEATSMGPTKIMIIRHAEKPVPGKVEGVRARGELDAASLTALGWQRAGALVSFFEKPVSPHIACPDHLFAVRFDIADADSSRRSRQTLRPLSHALGIPINDAFGKEQEAKLVLALRQLAGTVLIAWSHENIGKIVEAIGAESLTPREWPDERFDVVWVFDRAGQRTKFTQIPQRLLAGDSESVIPLE
jgi:broad specificity phosphatase PhoE